MTQWIAFRTVLRNRTTGNRITSDSNLVKHLGFWLYFRILPVSPYTYYVYKRVLRDARCLTDTKNVCKAIA